MTAAQDRAIRDAIRSVECPTCKAKPKTTCHTGSGRSHPARVTAAAPIIERMRGTRPPTTAAEFIRRGRAAGQDALGIADDPEATTATLRTKATR